VIDTHAKHIDVVFPLRDLVREALEAALEVAADAAKMHHDQQPDTTVLHGGIHAAPLVKELSSLLAGEVFDRVDRAAADLFGVDRDGVSTRVLLTRVKSEYGRDGLVRVLRRALDDLDGGFEWVDVASSNVARVGYHRQNRVLAVAFKHGGEYRFADVPRPVFDEMHSSESPGGYFHARVKGQYPTAEAAS
jgi:hypothetical protein